MDAGIPKARPVILKKRQAPSRSFRYASKTIALFRKCIQHFLRAYPPESDRWQKGVDRLLRLAGIDAQGPTVRAPREVRDTLARFGIVARPGNVRLPPLPPLWR